MTTKVVRLETAKKLKEAGWKQGESYWVHFLSAVTPRDGVYRGYVEDEKCQRLDAPDVSDLLEALPKIIYYPERDENWPKGSLIIRSVKDCREIYVGDWVVGYENGPDGTTFEELIGEHDSLAEALAALWLRLKEDNLI